MIIAARIQFSVRALICVSAGGSGEPVLSSEVVRFRPPFPRPPPHPTLHGQPNTNFLLSRGLWGRCSMVSDTSPVSSTFPPPPPSSSPLSPAPPSSPPLSSPPQDGPQCSEVGMSLELTLTVVFPPHTSAQDTLGGPLLRQQPLDTLLVIVFHFHFQSGP